MLSYCVSANSNYGEIMIPRRRGGNNQTVASFGEDGEKLEPFSWLL